MKLFLRREAREVPILLICLVCLALMFAGWAKFLLPGAWVYAGDYAVRGLVCAIVLSAGLAGLFHRPVGWGVSLIWSVGVVLAALLVLRVRWFLYVPDPLFFNTLYPPLDGAVLQAFDLTFGLALVAVSEEAVFRGLFARVWDAKGWSVWSLYAISGATFALLHAPQGLSLVVASGVIGLLLMALFRRTGSLWLPVAAHYAINVIAFSDMGCRIGVSACPI